MAIIKCPECGHQVSDQAKVCPSCGIEIAGKVMRCPECGETVFNDLDMCPGCNSPLHAVPPPSANPSLENVVAVNDNAVEPATGNNKKKYTVIAIAFVLVVMAVFVIVYFNTSLQQRNELDAYENAVRSGEPAVLQNYLDMYEDAPVEHRDSVEAILGRLKALDLEWANAVASGSKLELEKYLRLHPGSVHETEARMRIDSLDWLTAITTDTPEAYQAYIDAHGDGLHIDEARDKYGKLDAMKVTDEERQRISLLFGSYFNALATGDESALTATLSPVLGSFLHKADATKSDVMKYMDRLHEPSDITSMTFRPNNDWKIEKNESADGGYEYMVAFSVDHKIERTDTSKETFCTYKVSSKVSADWKISDFNMQRVVQ